MIKKQSVVFYIFFVLAIAINVFIIVEGAIDSGGSSSQSLGVTQFVIDVIKSIAPNSRVATDPDYAHHLVRKLIGHFGLFGVSGIITTTMFCLIKDVLADKKLKIVLIDAGTGFLVAILSEVMQLFAPGRAFAVTDILIDLFGYVLFGWITFMIFFLVYRHKHKEKQE